MDPLQIIVSERSDPQAIRDWIGLDTPRPKVMLVMGDPGDRTVRHCTSMAVARGMPIEHVGGAEVSNAQSARDSLAA